jgi:hypothetical protein
LTLPQEITKYKALVKDYGSLEFAEFWQNCSKTLPILATYVREYCIMNPTSVPSESTFSVGGFILGIYVLLIFFKYPSMLTKGY